MLKNEDDPRLESILQDALAGLRAMNKTMDRMPEGCSAEVYFRKVRPYIFGFDNIVYEGCFQNAPQTYRGETGAQSSIIPAVLMALGIRHKDSLLTKHLDDMRNYMPAPHRQFIAEQVSVRDQVVRLAGKGGRAGKRSRNCTTLAWPKSSRFDRVISSMPSITSRKRSTILSPPAAPPTFRGCGS